jgi:hypothetical protein
VIACAGAKAGGQKGLIMRKMIAIAGLALALTATVAHADQLPPDVMNTIRNKCEAEWPSDYHMRLYCEDKQIAAARRLQERGDLGAAKPSSNEATVNAVRAGMMFAMAANVCNLTRSEYAKLERSTDEILKAAGLTRETVFKVVDSAIINHVEAEVPAMRQAAEGDQKAVNSVCPPVHDYIAKLR